MRQVLQVLVLLLLVSCHAEPVRTSSTKLAIDCSFLQHVGALSRSCGNNKCDRWLGESELSCAQDCKDPLKSVIPYYAQSHSCNEATEVHSPASQAELAQDLRDIRARGKTIKVIGTRHAANDIICPSNGEVIATENFQKILGIEDYNGEKTVHFEGNVHFWELVNYLDSHGFALDKRIPGFGGISVAGFLATGAHGSDVKGVATLASSVVSLEVMDSEGNSKVYDKSNTPEDEWKALRANLGVLGIVTHVRLSIRPRYNMAVEIREFSDSILSDPQRFMHEAKSCEYLFTHYMRGIGKVFFTCGHETTEPMTHPEFSNQLFLPPPETQGTDWAVFGFQQAACSDGIARLLERVISEQRAKNPWLTYPDGSGKLVSVTKGVGSWHRVMQTYFDSSTQPKFSQVDWEVAFPARHLAAVLKDLKSFADEYNVIIPSIGMVFRFDQVQQDSFLAPTSWDDQLVLGEQMVHIEMPVYTPFGMDGAQFESLKKPYREFFLGLIEKYSARPHFGKNDSSLFLDPRVKARLSSSIRAFNEAKVKLEPTGAFTNDYLKKVGIE